MRRYRIGKPVVVIGGKYKGKTGQYLGNIGKVRCTVLLKAHPMNPINIQKSSICPVDRVEVLDLTNDNSHIIAMEEPISLSWEVLGDKWKLLDLSLHLVKTQGILKQEWFHGKHILELNKSF